MKKNLFIEAQITLPKEFYKAIFMYCFIKLFYFNINIKLFQAAIMRLYFFAKKED